MNADAPRIFYAEDNPGDVLLVRSALREIGHLAEIDTAKDGDQAMEWLRLLASSSGIEPLQRVPPPGAPATSTQSDGRPAGEPTRAAGLTARATRVAATASNRIPLTMEAGAR